MNSEKVTPKIDRSRLAVIHVAKKALGLSEDEYRAALEAHGGVTSARDLTPAGFREIMRHFEACGFQSSANKRRPGMATPAQLRKIWAMWLSLAEVGYFQAGQEKQALRGFLEKRFKVSDTRFLDFERAGQVIEAVKSISARAKKNGKRQK